MMSGIYGKKSGRWPGFRIQVGLFLIAAIFLDCASQSDTVRSGGNHRELADYYYKEKKYDKAKHELLMILRENPDDVESNFRLGVIYGNEGLINESRTAFEKVLSINSEYSKAYYNLGVLYSKGDSAEHIQKCMKNFNKYLELEPDAVQRKEIEKWKACYFKNLNEGIIK